jgi:ATP-binding cassette, subfamily B, bacterial
MNSNYNLKNKSKRSSPLQFAQEIGHYLHGSWSKICLVITTVVLSSASETAVPFLIILAIDNYISKGNLDGLNILLVGLGVIFLAASAISYFQTITTSRISQQILFELKKDLFTRIQEFPLEFFNQNKAGDIISRVNNDTEKLNNFFGQSVFQFVRSFFNFISIGLFIFWLNWQLAIIVWLPVVVLLIFNSLISDKVRAANKSSLESTSNLTSFLDENINNFRALVVFNKRSYLRESFAVVNQQSFANKLKSQILNSIFQPIYAFAGNFAQVIILIAGLFLLNKGQITIGLLVGFLGYSQKFYQPLQILGSIWGTMQEALSAWDRIQSILKLK